VVVLENVIREDTKGTTEAVNTKYDLLERGGYTFPQAISLILWF